MSATAHQPPPVDEPEHPLTPLTTYELNAYLCQLCAAVTFFKQAQAPLLALMRDKLAQALAEQEGPRQARPMPDRPHDVSQLTTGELQRTGGTCR